MPVEPPEQRYRWWHPNPNRGRDQYAILAGHVHTYWSHWLYPPEVPRRIAVRCRGRDPGGEICDWCLAGANQPKARYVFPVYLCGGVSESAPPRIGGRCVLVELGAEQYSALSHLDREGAGTVFILECPEKASRADVQVRFLRCTRQELLPGQQHDVRDLVAQIGMRELASLGRRVILGPPETSECPTFRSQS